MAKKKGGRRRKSGRLTKAEIKKAGGIKQAWRARKRGKRPKVKSPRRSARRSSAREPKRTKKRRRKSRRRGASEWHGESARHAKAARKGHRRRKAKKTRAAAKRRRKSGTAPKRRKTSGRRKRRTTKKQLRAARRNIKKAQRANRGRRASQGFRSKSSRREDYGAERRGRRRRRRRAGAMENPLSGVELFVGGILGVAGFGIGDFTDRLLATHALTDKGVQDANGVELYADNPPTTGSYAGLYNPTAICSPMNLPRWANAVLVPGTIFVVAHFVKAPTFRAAMQFFAFGYGVRGFGKGIIDLMAVIATKYGFGQRLYDGEMRAQVLKANSGNQQANALASLPAAGLGAVAKCGAGCECAKCKQPGVGWPSLPREPANATTGAKPPPNTPPQTGQILPPAQTPDGGTSGSGIRTRTPPQPQFQPGPLLGTPRRGGLYEPFGDYNR
jgi:hypothetical protein